MRRFFPPLLGLLSLGSLVSSPAHAAAPLALLDDEAEPSCDLDFSLARGTGGSFRAVFDQQDERNFYALDCDAGGARFSTVRGGQTRTVGSAKVAWAAQNRVTLQRRPFEMQLLVNGKVALRAFDATWTKGKVGTSSSGGWKIEKARLQPVEAVHFDDDFTREGGGGDSDWATPAGKWTLSAASTHISARTADMSANPFAYAVEQSPTWALASAGRHFWNDYDARVAVRPQGAGDIGVAAYVQDAQNYLAFRLSSRTEASPGKRSLVLVQGGKETVLKEEEGGFVPREWLQIGLRTSPGYVEALLDGAPVLRAKVEAFGQGGMALLSRGTAALWDDVNVRSYPFWRADFQTAGAWSGEGFALSSSGALSQKIDARLLTGRDDWSNYRVLISAPWTNDSSGGALAGWRDANNYTLLRWAGSASSEAWKNKIQAVQVAGGKEKVVASAPFGSAASSKRLELDAQDGAFTLVKDGRAQVSLALPHPGKFGLVAPGAGTRFSDPVIFFPPPPDPPKIASKFVSDGFMVGWASPIGEWPPVPDKDGLQFWNTAELFGAWKLDFPWRANWRGKVEMALFADRSNFGSGLILRGESTGDGDGIDWSLLRGAQVVTKAHVKISDLPDASGEGGAPFHLAWNNGLLSLSSAHGPVFAQPLDAPEGSAIGLRANGFRVRSSALNLWSANRDDFTFADAPTDFYAPSGKWSVFSRWPCYGDWSFFGGAGRQPSLWTKRTYGGDIVVEYYAHPQMDMPKEPGYSHPGDLNVSLCGDGQNPASGYSFVVSGRDNTRTQIYRQGKLVSDNNSEKASFHEVINHNMAWHRTWVYVRAQARHATQGGKEGVLVTLNVNNEPLGSFFDPSPLSTWKSGGRVCFWTLDSTLMLARAKVEAQTSGSLSVPASLHDTTPSVRDVSSTEAVDATPATPALRGAGIILLSTKAGDDPSLPAVVPVVENDEQTVKVSSDSGAVRVQNRIVGGTFAVKLNSAPQKITPQTRLSFDWKASSDAKVDVYVRTGEDWHLVELRGGQKPDALAPSLGKATLGAEKNGWTPVSFALGSALPGVQTVDEIRIGALHGNAYRWQGFDGNSNGAWYEVKGLELK